MANPRTGMSDLPLHLDTMLKEHLSGYQLRDYDVVDYSMHELPGTNLWFRGPCPDLRGDYFTCLGAAQTFGCFCEHPFPQLLAKELGMPALNLGYGGAGPEFFERQAALDRYINRGRFVVLQVMSGRSQSNSLFECRGLEYTRRRKDGIAMSADAAYHDLLFGVPSLAEGRWTELARRGMRRFFPRMVLPRMIAAPRTRRIVAETRGAWIQSHRRLLARIRVPVILFWFSKRAPKYPEDLRDVYKLFGEFPQLVNAEMVHQARELCGNYVECVSERGSPQELISRWTGLPVNVNPANDRPDLAGAAVWSHNSYYPSPEMHEDAVQALAPVCRGLLQK